MKAFMLFCGNTFQDQNVKKHNFCNLYETKQSTYWGVWHTDTVEFKMSFVKKAQALIKRCHSGGFACLPSIYLEVLCVLFPILSGQVLQKLKILVGEMEYKWIIRKPQ